MKCRKGSEKKNLCVVERVAVLYFAWSSLSFGHVSKCFTDSFVVVLSSFASSLTCRGGGGGGVKKSLLFRSVWVSWFAAGSSLSFVSSVVSTFVCVLVSCWLSMIAVACVIQSFGRDLHFAVWVRHDALVLNLTLQCLHTMWCWWRKSWARRFCLKLTWAFRRSSVLKVEPHLHRWAGVVSMICCSYSAKIPVFGLLWCLESKCLFRYVAFLTLRLQIGHCVFCLNLSSSAGCCRAFCSNSLASLMMAAFLLPLGEAGHIAS